MATEMMTSSELRDLNNERQTGVSSEDNPPVPKVRNYGYGNIGNALLQRAQTGTIDNGTRSYTREAAETGWGDSRYDSNNWYAPGMDLEQSRAFEQSSFAKIGSGFLKGGITAAATATNTVLGTALGLGRFFWEYMPIMNGFNPENAPDFMETLDAAVNNNISKWTTDLQKWGEEIFPNYRTEAERSEQYQKEWYKHMGTANFIGDSFLKNFGFTVGAMGGGMVWSKLLGGAMSKQLANDILKSSVVAAEGDAEANATLQRVAEAVRNGTVEAIDANKLAVSVKEAARQINKADALLQIYGATIGAMGEGNMEGLMAKQEFLDDYLQRVNDNFIQDYKNAEAQVLQEGKELGNEWIDYVVGENGRPDAILSSRGKMEVQRRRENLVQKLNDNREQANIEGDRLASTTFLLNLPILTTSNLIQFGRMFSGGWKTSRGNATKVKGGIETKLPERGTPRFEADYRSGAGKVGWNSVWNTLKVMGSESAEEMLQGTASSGAKQVAKGNMATFNNDGYDPDSIEQVRDWFSNMYEGGAEYLGDVKNWQEGALGALTGLFGIPGKVWKKGQRWNGGIPGAISEARERVSASETAAEKLNTLVNSKELRVQPAAAVAVRLGRHGVAEDGIREVRLVDGDDAGKLEDLSQIVDAYGSLSVQDAKSLKEAMKDNQDAVSNPVRDIRNMDDATVVAKVKEQADDIKKTITQYKDIYDALSSRAPIGTSPELLKELVFTSLQIKKYEDRFLQMLDNTLTEIEPLIDMISDFRQSGEHISDASEKKQRLSEVRTMYQNILGKVNLPVNIPKFVEDAVEKQLNILEEYAEGNEKLQKDIRDMRKLSADRKSYYRKLKTLQGDAAERIFQDQAITQEKGDAEAINQMNDIETEGLDTFEAVKKAYLEKNAKDKIEFAKTLASAEAKNPAIKQFMNMKRRHDGFRAYTEKNGFNSTNIAVTPRMLFSAMNDLLRNSNSEQELINMPDSVFMPLDEFKNTFSGLIPVSDGVYEAMKQAMRDTMRQYLNAENQTGSRNSLSQTPVQAPQPAITPTGYDAAQPASAAPAPTAAPAQNPQPAPAPAPTFTPGEENPLSESLGFTTMAENPTIDELAQEAEQLDDKAEVPGENKMVSGMIPYYRTSVPEISTGQVTKVRDGEIDRKDADYSDFPEYLNSDKELSDADKQIKGSADFTGIWNALKDAGAFETVATQLNVGDEIEFVIDPAFPKYEGQYQILVTTMKNGQRKILTILSGQNSKYFGLSSLRSEIDSEYRQFIDAHPNETFVFSKKSKVWAKRAGQIDYDYTGNEEKGIRDIPGYDASAPIVFINRNGDAQVVRGDENALQKVSPNTFTSAFNSQHKGALYYMSPNGDDAYIPIRLNVEHFTPETFESTNPLFVKARGLISSIAEQTASANKVGTNYEDENRKLRNKLTELVKLLDLHDLYLEIGNYTNIGPALKIVTWVKQDDGTRKEEHSYRTSDQITPNWLINKIAEMEVSFQIRQKEEGGTIDQLDDYIVNGIITSNAKMLRAKGVDFYFNAWDDESKSFKPMTAEQVKAEETPAVSQPSPETGMPPIPEALRGAVIGYSNRDEDDWFADDAEPAPDRIPVQDPPAIPGIPVNPVNDWQNLTEEQRNSLSEKGWTEVEFNTASSEEQEIALRC